jgi:hypothetical protein
MSPYMWEFQRWVRGYLMRSHNRQARAYTRPLSSSTRLLLSLKSTETTHSVPQTVLTQAEQWTSVRPCRQRMTFRNKLWVMLTMLVLQIAAHAYMTFEVGTDG